METWGCSWVGDSGIGSRLGCFVGSEAGTWEKKGRMAAEVV